MRLSVPVPLTLTPLTAGDEDLLCGRAAEVETIVENCRASRLTVVTSFPGLGASSLLRAGAEPALRRASFITVVYSDWQGRTVANQLREAIVSAVHEQADRDFVPEPGLLNELLTAIQERTGRPVAVLLDQFEDYVRCHSGTDISDTFDAELANAIATRSGRFVIALQALLISPFERLSQFVPNLMGFNIRLRPLSEDAARDLVRRIAARADMEVEDAAVDLLVSSPPAVVEGGEDASTGVHPLFLRLAVDRLIAAEVDLNSKLARVRTLIANGGADRMALGSLDAPVGELGRTHRNVLCEWIPLLVSADGRRVAVAGKALAGTSGQSQRVAETLLPLVVESGLLRTVRTRAGIRCELARESAAVVVSDWHERAEAALMRRQRAQLLISSILLAAIAIVVGYLIYRFLPRPVG